jgi:hypothetical protein
MKKYSILLVILIVSINTEVMGFQNPKITLSLSSPRVAVNNDVTLSVISDSNALWRGYLVLSEDVINWTDPVVADFDGSWSYNTNPGAGSVGDLGYAFREAYPASYVLQAAGIAVYPQAGTQFSINIKGIQTGTIYIDLQDYGDFTESSTNGPLALVVVPEPATALLIGAGLLFVHIRRK